MSAKQCEEKLTDKGVRPTPARILVLQQLANLEYPGCCTPIELESNARTPSQVDDIPLADRSSGTSCHPCL